MADQKIIAVVGATGMQGGGLVRALANEPNGAFKARALTRNVSSAKAKTLASLGVEMVTAGLDDLAGLQRAFAGAYGAFCVTNFWGASLSRERTGAGHQSCRSVKACRLATRHLVDIGRYEALGTVER